MLSRPPVSGRDEGRRPAVQTAARAALLAAGAALLLFAARAPVRTELGWDDTFYLLQGSSLVEDGDLDLRNDLLASDFRMPVRLELLADTTPAGSLDNEFSIGPALLWLPAYAAALPLRGPRPAGKAAVRWSLPQRDALHLLSLLALAGVLFFLLRLYALAAPAGERGLLPIASVAALLFGTPLLVYATSDYTMSHLPSALATSLLLAAALRLERVPRPAGALLAGVALGLVFLVRWQDLVFGALLAVPLLPLFRRERRRAVLLAAWAAAGFLAMASLQLHAWRLERGQWLVAPQGHGFFHPWDPAIWRFLVSGRSGLLSWSPVFGLAALGLLLPWGCRLPRRWAFAALAVLAAEVYVNAAAGDWWGGHSFGARRMVSCVPLLALGLANLAPRLPRRAARAGAAAALLLCCGWGVFVALLYWNGVQDLSLVLRGAPAEPQNAAMAGVDAVNDPAEARARAGRLSLSAPADYLAATGAEPSGRGILATWLLLAAAAAGAAAALARTPPRRLLAALLVFYLAAALAAHLRLALGPPPDAAERAGWSRLARQWRRPPRQYDPDEVAIPPEGRRWQRSPADAYRYVQLFLEWRAGDPARARALLQGLGARGYPAAAEARAAVARIATGGGKAEDGELVRWLPGRCFQPVRWRPALEVPLPLSPAAREWEIAFDVTPGELDPGEVYDLFHLLGAGGEPLADLAVRGGGGLLLAAPGAAAERPVRLAAGRRYSLRVRYALSPPAVDVTLAGDGPVHLAVVPAAAGPPAEIALGRPRSRRLGGALLRSAVFYDLWARVSGPSPAAAR